MPPSASSPRRNAKIAAIVLVVSGLGAARWMGVFERLREPERLARSLVDLGGWGYLAFVLAYAVLQPFGVPGTVFIIAAPLIWPWPVAFALSMTGTMAASVVGFSFARFVARDWVSSRIPKRFKKYEGALEHNAFLTVFVLRLLLWMPPLLHAFFGVSKVRQWTHFWASLAGYALPLFLVSFFGQRLFDLMRNAPVGAWIGIALGLVAVASGVWIYRHYRPRATVDSGEARGLAAKGAASDSES